ncbi:uncharacterized protein LOC126819756 [Patella vulgata]|uniref:uncharacterized protein LOC126819756 n=1 Tax=Patella vulgata TaxID=6465 RepID=UPI0024A9722F|nr:uncharacterized protein LOC126819756 [Patella vulgata]
MEARILLLAALVAGVLAGPINVRYESDDNTMCAQRCTESSKFRYRPGTTYEFDYNVQTHTAMEGASDEKATLGIKATAEVEVMSKCEFALKLRNVQVFQSDPSEAMRPIDNSEFRMALEANTLRFAFQDGAVEELCPVEGDRPWILNIKRGVLSTFQNTMDAFETDQSVHEADVTGKCMTQYKSSKNWYTTTITKSKNLLGCMDRQNYRSVIQAMPYRVPSEIQSLPLIKSEHECNQEVDNTEAYLKNVMCKETHVYRPFSNENSGALTRIIQKLKYKSMRQGVTTRPGYITRRANMFFEHAKEPVSSEMQRKDVERKLQEICHATSSDIRPQVPMMFSELVHLLRNLNTVTMRDIYIQVTSGSICSGNMERTKKFFLDAIPMVSTSSSVEMMKELLMNKEITGLVAEMWINTLAFIQAPTREMLANAKDILRMNSIQEKAMLPVSSLVNNFCTKTPGCSDMMEVSDIIEIFETSLGSGCYVRDSNLEKALRTLRAIGNAGHSNTIGSTVLSNCFKRASNPMEIKVAALEAFRRLPCSADRSGPMTIFRDRSEDSELRIAAYQAVMRCPSEDIINIVKSTLESEDANQVGSFVWSHLTNLMETSNPHKQNIRFILEDARLKKEFNMEKLKYSRNYEGSFMLEKINTGAMVESNIIWSSKSFIPRSANLNLTVDLFGNSVNLMDMGGRIEGLEYLLETYLGPLGYFGEKSSSKSVAKSKAKLDQLRGSMYMRMFGNEMAFTHFQGLDSLPKMKSLNFEDILKKLSNKHDLSFTQSFMFLDSSIIVPTSSGMPLNLTVNGVATVDMKASGEMRLNKLTANPSRLQIEGTIQPSGAVAITGCMSVDAYVTKSGLRMTSTLHSSTAAKGSILVHGGKIMKVEFDMPQDKMEILDVKTAFFTVHGDIEKEQTMVTDNRKVATVCTGSRMAKVTGLELCGEISFPNASMKADAPYFPFTGPVGVSLTLHKRDSHIGYRLLAKKTQSPSTNVVQLALDTPGSKIDRDMSFDFILDTKNNDMEVRMRSPWVQAASKGVFKNKDNLKSFNGHVSYNNAKVLIIDADTKVMEDGSRITYTPNIVIVRPKMDKYKMDGKVTINGMENVIVDLTMDPSEAKKMNIKFVGTNIKGEKSISGSVNYGRGVYSIIASLLHDYSSSSLKLIPNFELKTPSSSWAAISGSCEYKEDKRLIADINIALDTLMKKPISFSCNINRVARKNKQVKYLADLVLNSKLITMKVDGLVDRKRSGSTASRLIIDYNIPKSKKNKITLNSKYSDRSTKTLNKITWNSNLDVKQNPEYNFNSNIDLSHNIRHTEGTVNFKYGVSPKNHFRLETNADHKGSMKRASVAMKSRAIIRPLDIDVQINGDHKHSNGHLVSGLKMLYGEGKAIETSLRLKDDSKKTTKMGGEWTLTYPGKNIIITSGLAQASKKELQHTINLKMENGHTSSIVSTYKRPRQENYEVSSEINLHGMKPLVISGNTNLNLKNFKLGGQVDYAGETYSINSVSKYSPKEPQGKMTLDVVYPSHHINVVVDGGRIGDQYTGNLNTKWNADKVSLKGEMNIKSLIDLDGVIALKFPSRTMELNFKHSGMDNYISHADLSWSPRDKINVDLTFGHNINVEERNIASTISISTPFEFLPMVTANLEYTSDASKYSTSSLFNWGKGRDQISSNLSIMKPVSLRHIDLSWRATSPFTSFKRMAAEITHDADNKINTIVKGSIGNTNGELSLSGKDMSDSYKTDLGGKLELKSNIRNYETVSLEGKATYADNKYQSNLVLDRNGDRYLYDIDMALFLSGWQMQSNGNLVVAVPNFRIKNNWNHRHTLSDIQSTMSSEWGNRNKVYISLTALNHLALTRKINGDLKVQTPWEAIRDIELNAEHELASGFFSGVSTLKKNRNEVGSYRLNYKMGDTNGDMDFILTNPYTEDLGGKLNFKAGSFPITGHAELSWAPRQTITTDGTFSFTNDFDLDTTLRVTSPFTTLSSVVIKASNKDVNGQMVISTANIEYGSRKSIDLDSRVRYGDNKEITLKMKTPHPDFRSIDSHVSFAKSAYEIDTKADLEVLPVFGKFSSMFNAKWASDILAKLRMDTPFSGFPYLRIEAASSEDNNGRHSRIETEYSPRQLVSLISSYKMDGPIPAILDVSLTTPYEYLENVGASMTHKNENSNMQTHAEIRYAPYKMVEGDWSLNWGKDLEGILVVKTPFDQYENTKLSYRQQGDLSDFSSHSEIEALKKKMDADLSFSFGRKPSAKLIFHTPFDGLEEFKAQAEMRGSWNQLRMTSTINYGRSQEIEARLRNSMSSGRMDANFLLKTPFFDTLKLNIDHDGSLSKFTNKFTSSLGRRYAFNTDASFTMALPNIDVVGTVDYRLPVDTRVTTVTLHKDGEWDNMNAHLTGACNGQEIAIRGNMKARGSIESSITIATPFTEDIVLSIDHNGDIKDFSTKVSANIGTDYIVTSETTFNLELPIMNMRQNLNYRYAGEGQEINIVSNTEGPWENFKWNLATFVDGSEYSTSGNMKSSSPILASITINTPIRDYREMSAVVKHSGDMNRFGSSVSVQFMDGQKVEGNVNFYANGMNRIDASAVITTPFQNYENIEYKYTQNIDDNSLSCHGEISYGYSKQIVADLNASISPKVSGSIVVTTPFADFRNNRISISGKGSSSNFQADGEVELYGEKLNVESIFSHGTDTNGRFTLLATSANVKDITVAFNKRGDLNDFACTSKVTYGGTDVLDGRVAGRFIDDDKSLSLNIKNPYTETIDATIRHNGKMLNCTTTIDASIGSGSSVHSETTVKSNPRSFHVAVDNSYTLSGETEKAGAYLKTEGDLVENRVEYGVKYNDKAVDGSVAYDFKRGISIDALLTTPYVDFRNLAFHFKHAGKAEKFNTQSHLRYMDGQEVGTKLVFYRYMWRTVTTTLEINTPFTNLETSKLSYEHNFNDNSMSSKAVMDYGLRQKISGEASVTLGPKYTVDLNIETPFSGYETVVYSGSAENQNHRYSTEASFKLGNYNAYTMNADLNLKRHPFTGSLRMYTPISQLKNVDLSFSHFGDLKNLKSSGKFDTPITGTVSGEATLDFTSPYVLDGSLSLKSSLPNMDNLEIAVQNTESGDEHRSHIMFGWQTDQQITLDGGYTSSDSLYRKQYSGDFSMVTPFETIHSVNLRSTLNNDAQKYTGKVEADYNGDTLLDVGTEYMYGDSYHSSVTMHKPRPIEATMSGQYNDKELNADIFVNWNRDEPNSNIRLLAASQFGDSKELNIRVVNPMRTVAMKGSYHGNSYSTKSQGEFAWDEQLGRKIFYDFDMSDSSRRYKTMYDASFKLGTPSRTMQTRGGYSSTKSVKTIDAAFLWDAERDTSKQIGIKGNCMPGDNKHKADVTITLPNNQQDIRIGTEMTVDSGRTLFDGKTEFSYSPDSRKTLVLTSNVQDVSYDRNHNNYSLSLGIRHPYTNTDVQFTSHIGSSSEKYASGMQMQYLTASRKRINMALLGDIDRLRQQINLQIVSPLKNLDVSGEVKSMEPYQVVFNSRINGEPSAVAAVSIDSETRSFQFESNYDINDFSNMFHFDAHVVNDSAIRTELYLDGRAHRNLFSDDIILKRNRIVEYSMKWRPEMFSEFKNYATEQQRRFRADASAAFDEVVEHVGNEISYKYRAIAGAVDEEIRPFVDMVLREIMDLEERMTQIRSHLRQLHYDNVWYMRSMGDYAETSFLEALDSYSQLIESFNQFYTAKLDSILHYLEEMKSYPVKEIYETAVTNVVSQLEEILESSMEISAEILDVVNEKLREIVENSGVHINYYVQQPLSDYANSIYNHSNIQLVRSKVNEIRNMDLIGKLKNNIADSVNSLSIPERYNSVIYNTREIINQQLADIVNRKEVKYIQTRANDVYQEGVWAYNYWKIEENVEQKLRELFSLLKEIVEVEISQYREKVGCIFKSNVTVYDPQNGVLKAELYLPTPMSSLMDVAGYGEELKEMMNEYRKSIAQVYNDYMTTIWAQNNEMTVMEKPQKRQLRQLRRRKQ